MRTVPASLALLIALPACAQGADRHFYLDVHAFAPSLQGHFQGVTDGNPIALDFRNDLALERDKTMLGGALEYQGPRFGLELSSDEQTYAGRDQLGEAIKLDGQTYQAKTQISSSLKATSTTCNWTIRYLTWPQFWLGADLGARATTIQLTVSGTNAFSGVNAVANYKTSVAIPELGPSFGWTAGDNRLVGRGLVHLLTYKGATYTRLGADLRYFPLSWLGLRVFAEAERIRVPEGSIMSGLDATLDRSGAGLGVVARF
jgi:hypothetical protein